MKEKDKSGVPYVWTEKAERVFPGKAEAGAPATFSGRPLSDKGCPVIVNAWLKTGYIRKRGVEDLL